MFCAFNLIINQEKKFKETQFLLNVIQQLRA